MKRTDITDIWPEATKEQIDRIMDINGADISKAKGDLDSIQGQLGLDPGPAHRDADRTGGSEGQKPRRGAAAEAAGRHRGADGSEAVQRHPGDPGKGIQGQRRPRVSPHRSDRGGVQDAG